MTFERIEVTGPELAKLIQPVIHLSEGFRFEPIQTALCVHGCLHETGLPQHAQVLRDGRLRHPKLTLDLAHRLFRRDQRLRIARRFGSAMTSKAESTLFIYVTWNIHVKAYDLGLQPVKSHQWPTSSW